MRLFLRIRNPLSYVSDELFLCPYCSWPSTASFFFQGRFRYPQRVWNSLHDLSSCLRLIRSARRCGYGMLPSLPKPLPSLKFAYPFLFLSRGTLWDGKQIHPQPSVPSLKQVFPITLNSGKFISYASFWLFWFPGHSLCPSCHPLPTWIGKMACLS